jgi:hypothetical protein
VRGSRKLLTGLVGLLFLAGGYVGAAFLPPLAPLYTAYAGSVVAVVAAVVAANVGSLAVATKATSSADVAKLIADRQAAAKAGAT